MHRRRDQDRYRDNRSRETHETTVHGRHHPECYFSGRIHRESDAFPVPAATEPRSYRRPSSAAPFAVDYNPPAWRQITFLPREAPYDRDSQNPWPSLSLRRCVGGETVGLKEHSAGCACSAVIAAKAPCGSRRLSALRVRLSCANRRQTGQGARPFLSLSGVHAVSASNESQSPRHDRNPRCLLHPPRSPRSYRTRTECHWMPGWKGGPSFGSEDGVLGCCRCCRHCQFDRRAEPDRQPVLVRSPAAYAHKAHKLRLRYPRL